MAAGFADEYGFKIGQPDMARPAVTADLDRMRALVVGATHNQTSHSGIPHLSKGDLFCALHHGPSLARSMAGEAGFFTLTQLGDRPAR